MLDASRNEHHGACEHRAEDVEGAITLSKTGAMEQSTSTLHLLTAKEAQLRNVRDELHRRDESFARLQRQPVLSCTSRAPSLLLCLTDPYA